MMNAKRIFVSLGTFIVVPTVLFADGKKPTFDEDVAPILKQHCSGCHGYEKQRADLNLASYGKLMEGGSSGVVVKAGDADGSRLYSLTAHKEEPKMPPKSARIPDAQIAIIKLWIEQGLRENSGSKAVVAMKPKVDLSLKTTAKGKPEGPPPLPKAGQFTLDPPNHGRRPVRSSHSPPAPGHRSSPWGA